MIATYTIQQWLFDTARGAYDIDLAESGVQFQTFDALEIGPDWSLDYSVDRGTAELRAAVATLYAGSAAGDDPEGLRVIVTHGAQEALYLLYRSTLRAGDHVITTRPGWQQSWEVPAHIGCEVTALEWAPGTRFDLTSLEAAIRPTTRMIVLNSPCNPTGSQLGEQEMSGIIALAAAHGLLLVNDEEYLLDFDRSVVRGYERAVSVSGLSKVYGMPALRIGWATGPADVIEAMVNYKRYTTVSNSLVWERAAVRVLAERERHVARYHALVTPGLDRLRVFAEQHREHAELVEPAGTPYAWLRLRGDRDSRALAEQLLAQERVLVMPAEVFDGSHGIRVSHARLADVLDEGLTRLGKVLAGHG